MLDSLIGIDVSGIEQAQKHLDDLTNNPPLVDEITGDVAEYLIGILKQYPTQRSISRADAYPEVGGWFSERQRRWFFAAINSGELQLPYTRTQSLAENWQVLGDGDNRIVVNDTEYGTFVMGDSQGAMQSRQQERGGWKTLPAIVAERQKRITEMVEGLIKRRVK